tara:strand:- start:38 stop:463 length:426 start_codon:yes stop_codon:yes gene_type:complete
MYKFYYFIGDDLFTVMKSRHATSEMAYTHEVESFFRYACSNKEAMSFKQQLAYYTNALKKLVENGIQNQDDASLFVVCYLSLWKFRIIPDDDLIVIKNKVPKMRLKRRNKMKGIVNEVSQEHPEPRSKPRSRKRKTKTKRF